FKGAEYQFGGIAVPVGYMVPGKRKALQFVYNVMHHSGEYKIKAYTDGGMIFLDSDYPHVLYSSTETGAAYAREVDDFFATVEKDGVTQKRFTLLTKRVYS